jgi:glutamate-1-semialdehyde 2,1-aminomutase
LGKGCGEVAKELLRKYERENTNEELFREAKKYIAGGVNSPVRSFKAVGGYPVFIKKGKGSKIYSEYGREFIDYCLSFGALILGHAYPEVTEALLRAIRSGTNFGAVTKLETELAALIVEALPSMEKVRLTNSGTEAVMSAVRLARAYTKKNKIVKFEGAYHGHADYLLVEAGSGALTLGTQNSLGVLRDFTKHTIVLPFNNIKTLREVTKKYQKDLAAIVVEPVAANCGLILPRFGFLEELRKIADRYNIILIFDEVITGFRLTYGGAQGYFNVKPDLSCLGKIIGAGLPVGAFGGKKEIMQLLAPEGRVYQASTFAGNPVVVTAGIVILNRLKEDNLYRAMQERTKELCEGIKVRAQDYKIKLKVNYISSIFSIFFTDRDVIDSNSIKTQNVNLFKRFFHGLLKRGVYFSPSGFEVNFISSAHTALDIEKTLKAIDEALKDLPR